MHIEERIIHKGTAYNKITLKLLATVFEYQIIGCTSLEFTKIITVINHLSRIFCKSVNLQWYETSD